MAVTTRYPCTDEERRRIHDKFTNIFLIHTIEMLWDSGDWPAIPRVMRFYREEALRLHREVQRAAVILREDVAGRGSCRCAWHR